MLAPATKGADYLDKLMLQARRTQKIIQDLLTFSRQRKPERHVLDLNVVVDGALLLRESKLAQAITLLEQPAPYGKTPPKPLPRKPGYDSAGSKATDDH